MIRIFVRDAQFNLLRILALPYPVQSIQNVPLGGYLEHVFPDGKKWTVRLMGE